MLTSTLGRQLITLVLIQLGASSILGNEMIKVNLEIHWMLSVDRAQKASAFATMPIYVVHAIQNLDSMTKGASGKCYVNVGRPAASDVDSATNILEHCVIKCCVNVCRPAASDAGGGTDLLADADFAVHS